MKSILFGLVILGFAGMVLTSPYWFFREVTRPNDEELPDWMGDPRTRQKSLILLVGALALVIGGLAIAAGLSEP